jgi:hypothetical protein
VSGLQDLRDIIIAVVRPLLDSRALYPAKVIASTATTVDIRPESPLWGDMQSVPLRNPGGMTTTLAKGSRVYFGWDNGDRTKGAFAALIDTSVSPIPSATKIDTSGTMTLGASSTGVNIGPALGAVIRVGDTILISPGNGAGPVAGVVSVTIGLGVPPLPSTVKA